MIRRFLAISLIAFFLFAKIPSAYAAISYTASIGSGQLTNPFGVAIDSESNVYVTDNSSTIKKFDSNGGLVTSWGSSGSGDGEFSIPQGIAADSSNNIYIVDGGNNRIQKFDSDGNFITKWGSSGSGDGQFSTPIGIDVDHEGNVYVADALNNRIQKFDSDGNFITKWGSSGSGDGQFNLPVGIAVDGDGNVFVCEISNLRIQKFDSDGNFITKWGSSGSGDGQFSQVWGVAVNGVGDVYVTDNGNNRIQKFDNDGNFILGWGSSGSDEGEFSSPLMSITVKPSGNVYIADGNDYIQIYFDTDAVVAPTPTPTSSSSPGSGNTSSDSSKDTNPCPGFIICPNVDALTHNVKEALQVVTSSPGLGIGELIIPPTSSSMDLKVTIQEQKPVELITQSTPIPFPWQQGLNTASEIFQFSAVSAFNGYPVGELEKPATILLTYDPTKLYGKDPSQLRIAYYNQYTGRWVTIPQNTVINPKTNTIANTTTTFSYYTVVYPRSGGYTQTQTPQSTQPRTTVQDAPKSVSTPKPTLKPTQQTKKPQERKTCFLFICW